MSGAIKQKKAAALQIKGSPPSAKRFNKRVLGGLLGGSALIILLAAGFALRSPGTGTILFDISRRLHTLRLRLQPMGAERPGHHITHQQPEPRSYSSLPMMAVETLQALSNLPHQPFLIPVSQHWRLYLAKAVAGLYPNLPRRAEQIIM